VPGRAHHTSVKEAAHQFRQSIPEDGKWTHENYQQAKDAHSQLLQKAGELKEVTGPAAAQAKDATQKSADCLTQHQANVQSHADNVDQHAANCDSHANNVDAHEGGSDGHQKAQADHQQAQNDHQQAQASHQQAQDDCNQAQTDHDDNTDHDGGCDQNDQSASDLHDTITNCGDALHQVEGALGDSGEHEDKDLASKLCGDADKVVQKVEDPSCWHDKALDNPTPPAPAPTPPAAPPTPPTTTPTPPTAG
jgi:hypothetical protein